MTAAVRDPFVVRGRPVSDTLGEVSNDPPAEREIDVLYVSPDRFHASPQRGLPCRMTFSQLAGYLSRPSVTESKGAAGAWSPALYRDAIRRKAGLIHVEALVVDVDKGGDVDAAANALSTYRTVVHSTFSSTPDDPRCRIVLALAGAVDIATYNRTHAIVRAHLRARGLLADEAAKDASRVSYSPCVRAGAGFAFRETKGKPIDAAALVAARESDEPRTPARNASVKGSGGRYTRAALQRAAANVARAREGERHATLYREAFSLARLPLDMVVIAGELLSAAMQAGLPKVEAARSRTSSRPHSCKR